MNKVVTAMTSAQNPHGGQEQTLTALYTSMFHWGAIVVTPGYSAEEVFAAGGNPYGTSSTVDGEGNLQDDVEKAVKPSSEKSVYYYKTNSFIKF